ncbi:helix-turn-helix domain-containing protein [Enterococcus dispar]|jgi:transcriptional regulator with XRE-family HTH domain|uniref:helix-turn-helix domain-containing protein n=1 Tax=Enterococcus dispar TaxID=44009 RepID=UPI0021D41EF4|nr:helix-turn-helix transcriptional regulator [Enterococcus dispar]MCU7356654.1 helix-turn-helix domain-containing protein [Enterococcus dispar]MDT2704365.1 helix-turn-helix transcriptional regulator [Enterococcus dispar]
MSLGDQLRSNRKRIGLSQGEVATQLNITRQSISKWETGKGYPDLDNLVLLSEIYDVSIDELLKEDERNRNRIVDNSNAPICIEDNKIESGTESHKEMKRDDSLLLMILAIVSCPIPPLGIIIPLILYKKITTTDRFHKLLKFVCICCCLLSIYNSFLLANSWIFHYGDSSVELIE